MRRGPSAIEIAVVARHGTKIAQHGVSPRVSEVVSNEIAVSDGGN